MARTARIPNWIATEELQEPEIVAPEVAEVPSETLEAQLVEVDGLDRQLESLVNDGQEITDDAASLDDVAATVEASQEAGGMDETSADLAEIAVESYTAKWGIKRPTIAKENFGDSTTRLNATKLALEAIDGAKKGLFARFLELIEAIINKARDIGLKFHNAGKSLNTRADKLKAQYEAKFKDGEGSKKEESLKGEWVKFCVIDDEVNVAGLIEFAKNSQTKFTSAAAGVDSAMKKLNDAIQGVSSKLKDGPKWTVGAMEKGTLASLQQQEDQKDIPEVVDLQKGLQDAFAAARGAGSAAKTKTGTSDMAMDVQTAAFPGNLYLTESTEKGVGVIMTVNTKETKPDLSVPALSKQQIFDAINATKSLASTMENHIKSFRYYDSGLKTLKDQAKAAQGKVDSSAPDDRKTAEAVLKVARQAIVNTESSRRAFKTAMQNAGQGLSGLIPACISNY